MKCIIHFDGACEPVNPSGTATWGYVIQCDGRVLAAESGVLGSGPGMTNNKAEYTACIEAVKKANELGCDELVIKGDSQLVILQMAGEWDVRSISVIPLYEELCSLIRDVDVKFQWIPRKRNAEADKLSKKAYLDLVEAGRRGRAKEITEDRIRQVEDNIYEVIGSTGNKYRIDLERKTCTCIDFKRHRNNRMRIRCKHIIACESVRDSGGVIGIKQP